MPNNPNLSYLGSFVPQLVYQSDVDFVPIDEQFAFPDLSTPQTLVVQWSNEEYVEILSALSIGAFVIYGDRAVEVIEQFLKIVGAPLDLCSEIANCIGDSEAVQAAILNFLSDNGFANGNSIIKPLPLPESATGENLLPEGYTCDTSHLCGMARAIVNSAHDNTTELLQALEEGTDPLELVAIFVDNFEGVSWFGGSLEFGAWLQDELIENYDSAWSPTVENILTCAVYCKIEPECSVTLDLIIAAYAEFISATIALPDVTDIEAIWEWLTNVVFGTVGASAFVAAFHWCAWQTLRFGGQLPVQFLGLRSLRDTILEAEDETDTYCASLPCDCSDDGWCYEFDFSVSDGGFLNVNGSNIGTGTSRGVWASGAWQNTYNGTQNSIIIYIDMGAQVQIDYAEIEYSKIATSSGNLLQVSVQTDTNPANQNYIIDENYPTAPQDHTTVSNAVSRTGRYLRINTVIGNDKAQGDLEVFRLRVSAPIGINPFGSDNC